MAKHRWKVGQKVRITEGLNSGLVGTIYRVGAQAVGLTTEDGYRDVGVLSLEALEAPPTPTPRAFVAAENPDGSSVPTADALAALGLPEELSARVFEQHGRHYVSARGLAPADVESLRGRFADGSLGLHISQLGTGPGLLAWLEWPGMAELRHLSFAGAFLGAKGSEGLVKNGPLAQLESLDLSVNDVGRKGLTALRRADIPGLEELYLIANPDFDRGRYNAKALDVLVGGTKPIGSALQGISVLGLLWWDLADASELLSTNTVLGDLATLWVSEGTPVPEPLAARCVVGWEKRPLH